MTKNERYLDRTMAVVYLMVAFGLYFLSLKMNEEIFLLTERINALEAKVETYDNILDGQALSKEILIIETIDKQPIEKVIISEEDKIYNYILEISDLYGIDPYLINSIIYHESRYDPKAVNYNSTCVGLMQVSTYWHEDRANRLGVKDFFDPYGNILIGVDYLSELFNKYKSTELVLMLYNGNNKTAIKRFENNEISDYALSVIQKANELSGG